MKRKFFEVFPTLVVNTEQKMLFEDIEVTKVSSNAARDFIRIHIYSKHLILKNIIITMEELIKKQIFGRSNAYVSILEQYELSTQYTPQNLFEEYRNSILLELGTQSIVLANVFRGARCYFEKEHVLYMELENTIVVENKRDELIQYLKNIFEDRFGMNIEVQFQYIEPKVSNMRLENEQKLKREVEALAAYQTLPKEDEETRENAKTQGNTETSKNSEIQENRATQEMAHKHEVKPQAKPEKKPYVKREYQAHKKDDPNVVYGRGFDDEAISLDQVIGEMGEITILGQVIKCETREIRNEKTIIIFSISDFTDTIVVKMFVRNEQLVDILPEVEKGKFLKIKGVTTIDKFDGELTIGSILGIKKASDFTKSREDTSIEKRVELHCHTKMSDMDGVSDTTDILKRAHAWGHKAIAITDHGVVQAFPDAHHFIEKLPEDDPFKVIYGVEGYLVDDLTEIAVGATEETFEDTFVVFDLETTGLSAIKDKIIEIGAVKIQGGKIIERYSTFVNPKRPIPFEITKLTGIQDAMVLDAPIIEKVLPEFLEFIQGAILVAHNAGFDVGFLAQNCRYQEIEKDFLSIDTLQMAQILLPTLTRYRLNLVAKTLNIPLLNHHRAVDDAETTAEIFIRFIEMLRERDILTLRGLNQFGNMNPDAIRKQPSYHTIILAKNEIGRRHLYTLISESHLLYFGRRPRIPKSVFNKYREGLIIGSACEAGELYQAILKQKSEKHIAKLVNFYDYLEIQPLANNQFMIESDKINEINSREDLKDINRQIVALGERFKKPVVATCDVHFLDPDDEIYRRIIMTGKGFSDADNQPPLYLRTTEEMLDEFEYLGSDKAKEVVITNPNKIADMVEKIAPVRPDKCPPVIDNSDQELRDICYKKAHAMYGENLPSIVVDRLERELHSIISNGYSVMYIIAEKLVKKSNEDGYLVGSRGSVGSSFAATMAGITEVNPLIPHYYCEHCHYHDFDSDEVKAYVGGCGFDMPDKVCPKCNKPLCKDGFDIPFETFLGFKGDKEPDIDLNFSGDYQAKAHKYTEIIFGEGQTFRAGTIGKMADKTAFGYVKKYYDEKGIRKRKCEIERVLKGCAGVRRSTGQHPGGIIVLPHGEDINSFTPVQHPANDMTTNIITTHFDYHSIDHNLLKLDILGHDDPTIIKTLESYINSEALDNEYDGVNTVFRATDVALDDADVMALFAGTSILGIEPKDIDGIPLGCLGVPEFGTEFVVQMVVETKPKNLSDLIRISGLSHGTDVWINNAQTLIRGGEATISTAICTRDDIMTYLINMGMDSALSFAIMESVRKGKGLREEWETSMREANVPEWYIGSCKQIQYMFPKAHAAAYVMMAYRIAYCKVNHPLAYYAAYFSIRATSFSYELMCRGKERLEVYIKDYKRRSDSLTEKEQNTLKEMRSVLEMYARGFEFLPIDIYRAKAQYIQIIDGKLMPPLSSIEGMGDKAAEAVEQGGKQGAYLSRDDFRQRTKVSKTVVDFMDEMGLFGELPESDQLSLFD